MEYVGVSMWLVQHLTLLSFVNKMVLIELC